MNDPMLEVVKRINDLEKQVQALKAQLIIPHEVYATVVPTTGAWKQGQIVWSSAPVSGGVIGAVCVTAGTPGVWKLWGAIQ